MFKINRVRKPFAIIMENHGSHYPEFAAFKGGNTDKYIIFGDRYKFPTLAALIRSAEKAGYRVEGSRVLKQK